MRALTHIFCRRLAVSFAAVLLTVALAIPVARADVTAGVCNLGGLNAIPKDDEWLPAAGDVVRRFVPFLEADGEHRNRDSHAGIDIAGVLGTSVQAAGSGIVVFASGRGETGNTVEIVHGNGLQSAYGQLSEIRVREGECVSAGNEIGLLGCSGVCSEPNLHFELRKNGEAIDPAPYLNLKPVAPIDPVAASRTVDRSKLLDSVIAVVEKEFLDKALLAKIGWVEKARAVRAEILSAPTSMEAVRRINAILALLETSHTALFSPDDAEYYILRDPAFTGKPSLGIRDPAVARLAEDVPPLPGIGVFTRRVDGKVFVDAVLDGSPAERAGMRYGDEILSVGGAVFIGVSDFIGRAGETVKIAIRRQADADPLELDVQVPWNPKPASATFSEATLASARVIERDGKHIGYVRLWGFHQSDIAKAIEGILKDERIGGDPRRFDHLIVDARGRVGGNSGVVYRNLRELALPQEDFIPDHKRADTAVWHSANGTREAATAMSPGPPLKSFRGRSALLIDHRTRSAGEIFAHAWRRGKFGPVLGTTTQGAVVSGATYLMPGGLLLYVGRIGHKIDGLVIEGQGVPPDIVIERPLPYAAGADPVLEAAIATLMSSAVAREE